MSIAVTPWSRIRCGCVVWMAALVVGLSMGPAGDAAASSDHSVARIWNETLLDAIRRDFPAPTVHSRNLFHTSAAMWDAWAAYDDQARGYFVHEKHTAADPHAARREAISYAAYRVLTHRYANATGGDVSLPEFDQTMTDLGYDPSFTDTSGDSPAAFGNRIAQTVIEFGQTDGANEAGGYSDPDGYTSVNDPLVFDLPGTQMNDPNRWQPLAFQHLRLSQNGLVIPQNVQEFVGSHWGSVTPFAMDRDDPSDVYDDPGPPPQLVPGDPEASAKFKHDAVEVIRRSSMLDPTDGEMLDISPGARHNNPLGSNDGTGYLVNPATGQPYQPNEVNRADYGRVIAEFWADGPQSETPPGHWNTLANYVADHPDLSKRIGGNGPVVDDLEWDVKTYFALNGATHDAAIAAWDAKAKYDYSRPISMIRYMGGLGQSSDPGLASYHPDGLPLETDLVEVITEDTILPGGRHDEIADGYEGDPAELVGEIAIRSWRGDPGDHETLSGVGWIRAVEWMPYQRSTFVTPAFAAYVSGHSTFSRAAAEVLAALTGSPFFPGGLGTYTVEAGHLEFEAGPTEDVMLTWATYFDAADEAGDSRLWGGIHVEADDFNGRIMGAQVGHDAWNLARTYFVPEPASLVMVTFTGLCLLRRRPTGTKRIRVV